MNPAGDAREITKASKSNLALAFFAISRERRKDITTFYAFCRLVDDIADDPELDVAKKKGALEQWRTALEKHAADEPSLGNAVRSLIVKYDIPIMHFHEILDGVEMDLGVVRYETFEELRDYCYRVASAVGLVSIRIFGCTEPASEQYAIDLGIALQLTNILRDVGVDLANGGRIYLPIEDMERFGYPIESLEKKVANEPFRALMRFEADRARAFFQSAAAARPAADGKALIAAEIMCGIYSRLLEKMALDGFQVFEKKYRLSRLEKLRVIARVGLRGCLNTASKASVD